MPESLFEMGSRKTLIDRRMAAATIIDGQRRKAGHAKWCVQGLYPIGFGISHSLL
jgi:hypothetical protein